MKNGEITSKGTINSIFNSEETGTTSTEPVINKFKTQEDAKEYYNKELK